MNFNFLLKCIIDLSEVKRFSQTNLSNPESVLEHTAGAAIISYFVGLALKNEYKNIKINIESLLGKALIHDFDEIATGDVARPVKYFSRDMRLNFEQIETESMNEIIANIFPNGPNQELSVNWRNSKNDLEGKIVALSDFICVVYKIHNEICTKSNLSCAKYFHEKYYRDIQKYIMEIDFEMRKQDAGIEESKILTKINISINFLLREIKNKIDANKGVML